MTRLANEIVQAGLKDSPGWRMAEAQQEAMQNANEGIGNRMPDEVTGTSTINRCGSLWRAGPVPFSPVIGRQSRDLCRIPGSRISHRQRHQWERLGRVVPSFLSKTISSAGPYARCPQTLGCGRSNPARSPGSCSQRISDTSSVRLPYSGNDASKATLRPL